MTEYNYTDADFTSVTNGVDIEVLGDTIWTNANIATLYQGARSSLMPDDSYTITFVFVADITASEQTELDSIVAAHTGIAPELSALDKEKEGAKISIDVAAGEARAKYITVAPGQDAVYVEKEVEAKAHKDAGYPADLTPYPFIEAEKNAQGVTEQVASDTILATATTWKVLAASIEEIRLDYKNQVGAATDISTVQALAGKGVALLNTV